MMTCNDPLYSRIAFLSKLRYFNNFMRIQNEKYIRFEK